MVTPECEKLQKFEQKIFKNENSKTNNNQCIIFTACFEFSNEMFPKKKCGITKINRTILY